MRCILKNAKVFSQGVFHLADVFLSGGKIVSIGNGASRSDDTITIDISNMVLFPGFVDVHVHLREPGFSYKETIRTGTLAAAHGGFAHVAAMPNLNPVPDCVDALNLQRALIEKDALVHVHPYGAITVGEKGEQLADLAGMAQNVIAFSDDGHGVQSARHNAPGDGRVPPPRQDPCRALRGQCSSPQRLHPRWRVRPRPRAPRHLL